MLASLQKLYYFYEKKIIFWSFDLLSTSNFKRQFDVISACDNCSISRRFSFTLNFPSNGYVFNYRIIHFFHIHYHLELRRKTFFSIFLTHWFSAFQQKQIGSAVATELTGSLSKSIFKNIISLISQHFHFIGLQNVHQNCWTEYNF